MIKNRKTRVGEGVRRIGRTWIVVGGAAMAVHSTAGVAWAQKRAALPGEDGGWMQWVITVTIAVVVYASAFINPKRSHLT